MKKIVTVFVVGVICFLAGMLCREITTKAATKENLYGFTNVLNDKEIQSYSASDSKGTKKVTSNKKKSSKKTTITKKAKKTSSTKTKKSSDTKKNSSKKKVAAKLENTQSEEIINAGSVQYALSEKETTVGKEVKAFEEPAEVKKYANSNKKSSYTSQELRYMTAIIYCEARGESYQGQKAVGIVVMNRKKSDEFPNGIKKVIYQRGQFTPARSGSLSNALALYDKYNESGKFKGEMPSCLRAAKEVLEGETTIKVEGKEKNMKDCLYFSRSLRNAKFTLGHHQFR